jgi:hypothetical protein
MCDLLTDTALRIAAAEPDELRAIYHTEINAPIWTDEERETLMQTFGTRAAYWNALAIGLQRPRWAVSRPN